MNRNYPDTMLPYLDNSGRELDICANAEGNFCVGLPEGFSRKPAVNCGLGRSLGFRYGGRSDAEWIYVEHFAIPNGHEGDNIESWVDADLELLRKPMLHFCADGDIDYDLIAFDKMPAICSPFMAKHKADAMITYVGTIRFHETVCRIFILCVKRGNEAWKVEYAFPALISTHSGETCSGIHVDFETLRMPNPGEKALAEVSKGEMLFAGKVFGNFAPTVSAPKWWVEKCYAFFRHFARRAPFLQPVCQIMWRNRSNGI